MNKILMATTALVMTAGVASAEVAITGSAYMGFAYNEDKNVAGAPTGNAEVTTDADVNINFALSGETDGGLGFGAFTNHIVNDNGGNVANDDTGVYISGAFGKLTFGAVAEAGELGGLSDFGDNGIGFDNVAEITTGDDNGIGHNVNYTGSFGAIEVQVSAAIGKKVGVVPAVPGTPDKNEAYGVGAKYNFGDYYVGLGYNVVNLEAASSGTDFSAVNVAAGGKFGAFGVAALYSQADREIGTDVESYGVIATYSMDALTLSAGYADNDLVASSDASYAVGATYDLGGGAKVIGTVGSIVENGQTKGRTKAELGIKMSF